MPATRDPVIAVSSWSLHRTIGLTWWESPAAMASQKEAYGAGSLAILDLPAAVARHGIHNLQLCHFHVADRGRSWLGEFRAACRDAGVTLTMLLIDDADISDAANHKRDVAWVNRWIDAAAEIGALSARVVAGKQKPAPETLALSVAGLKEAVRHGESVKVRIVTENWHDLLASQREVNHVLDAVPGLGLLADFGNWKGEWKYDALAAIMPRADDTHAKCSFSGPVSVPASLDGADYGRCVAIADDVNYRGPYTLIYDGPDADEWAGITAEAAFVRSTLAGRSRLIA
jgi:sugar phosphate isomerase/epimerase